MRDLISAVRTLALTTVAITDLVGERLYINEIPREDIEVADTRHPPKMLVLRQGGGGGKIDILPLMDVTVIALCYGPTNFEAERVLRVVAQRFILLEREIHDEVLIHHINSTGGPIPNVESDLVWPVIAQSFTVKADILEVA